MPYPPSGFKGASSCDSDYVLDMESAVTVSEEHCTRLTTECMALEDARKCMTKIPSTRCFKNLEAINCLRDAGLLEAGRV